MQTTTDPNRVPRDRSWDSAQMMGMIQDRQPPGPTPEGLLARQLAAQQKLKEAAQAA
mgnify:CR=1 FL=1